jgi:hypothetical protein
MATLKVNKYMKHSVYHRDPTLCDVVPTFRNIEIWGSRGHGRKHATSSLTPERRQQLNSATTTCFSPGHEVLQAPFKSPIRDENHTFIEPCMILLQYLHQKHNAVQYSLIEPPNARPSFW